VQVNSWPENFLGFAPIPAGQEFLKKGFFAFLGYSGTQGDIGQSVPGGLIPKLPGGTQGWPGVTQVAED
jgi:hypothetical protein